jgi:hypothetical protein
MADPVWLRGVGWYSVVAIRRRFRSDWAIYASIGSGSSLVFIVVCLHAMVTRQIDARFLSHDDGTSISYAATLLLAMGILVAFANAQLLMQRFVRDHFVEFGMFVNIGVPRGIVAVLIALEQLGFAFCGGVLGVSIGCVALAAFSFSPDYVPPAPSDVWSALLLAFTTPCGAVVPVAVTLLLRLLRERGGIARVR